MRKWYAVQKEKADGWGYGSYDIRKATEMLSRQGDGLIAVIDEETNTCIKEILYEELGAERTEFGGVWT